MFKEWLLLLPALLLLLSGGFSLCSLSAFDSSFVFCMTMYVSSCLHSVPTSCAYQLVLHLADQWNPFACLQKTKVSIVYVCVRACVRACGVF